MSLNVTIVTVANKIRQFNQTDDLAIKQFCETLRRSTQLFTNRSLIIGSDNETELLLPSAITRIEVATKINLSPYLPPLSGTSVTLIPDGAETPQPEVGDSFVTARMDCYFVGGDTVKLLISGPRPAAAIERLANMTRLFENPIIVYSLPSGGFGFINPANMTRAVIKAGSEELPAGSWRLNPV